MCDDDSKSKSKREIDEEEKKTTFFYAFMRFENDVHRKVWQNIRTLIERERELMSLFSSCSKLNAMACHRTEEESIALAMYSPKNRIHKKNNNKTHCTNILIQTKQTIFVSTLWRNTQLTICSLTSMCAAHIQYTERNHFGMVCAPKCDIEFHVFLFTLDLIERKKKSKLIK